MRPHLLITALAFVTITCSTHAFAEPTTVFVVRHAERAAEPVDDPALSPEGKLRAVALADAFAGAKVSAIITTNYRRTKETAEPLAKKLGLQTIEIGVRKNEAAAHVPEVVAAIKKLSGAVLVVGHSNTVGQIITALTGEPMLPLCETSFSHVFVVNPIAKSVAKLRVGGLDSITTLGCQ